MPEKLLRNKLLMSRLRPNLVFRPRLIASLEQGLTNRRKLTLVSAPAGFGKTTLLCEWLGRLRLGAAREGQRVRATAWLSLYERGDDPARFRAYAAAAINRYEALQRGIAPDYVQRLLAAFPVTEPAPRAIREIQSTTPNLQPPTVEALSKRELKVLQQIAGGLTNREIADRLYLALNTVKAHTRNIYGKPGLHLLFALAATGSSDLAYRE